MRRLQIFGFRATTRGASRDPEGRWTQRTPLPTDVPPGSLLDRHRLAWRLTEVTGFLGLALVPAGFAGWTQQLIGGAGLAATLAFASATIAAAARYRRHVIRCRRCETHLMDFTDVYPLSLSRSVLDIRGQSGRP